MDKFRQFNRSLKWDFTQNALPEGVRASVKETGKAIPKDMTQGGKVTLLAANKWDEARIDTPSFKAGLWDEIRFKAIVGRNTKMSDAHIIRIGLYTANDTERLYFDEHTKPIVRYGGVNYAAPTNSWGLRPTHFEIIWKPKEGVTFYLDNRMVAKREAAALPSPELLFKGTVLCGNEETTSTIEKWVDVYSMELEFIVYSK